MTDTDILSKSTGKQNSSQIIGDRHEEAEGSCTCFFSSTVVQDCEIAIMATFHFELALICCSCQLTVLKCMKPKCGNYREKMNDWRVKEALGRSPKCTWHRERHCPLISLLVSHVGVIFKVWAGVSLQDAQGCTGPTVDCIHIAGGRVSDLWLTSWLCVETRL